MIPLPYLALAATLLAASGYALGRFHGSGECEDAHALKEAQMTAQTVQRIREKETEFQVEVAKIDTYYREVIDNAKAHSADLARQLDDGTVRLRKQAACLGPVPARPAAPSRDHVATSSGSGDQGIAVRAVAIAREADAQLQACQAYARAVSGG